MRSCRRAIPSLDTPDWLEERWTAHYGEDEAAAIAEAHRAAASVDLTVKDRCGRSGPSGSAAILLPTGSVRLLERTPVRGPARLRGRAPGGSRMRPPRCRPACCCRGPASASPISARRPAARPPSSRRPAPDVLAVDRSAKRLERLAENLARLKLSCRNPRGRRRPARRAGLSTPSSSTRPARRPAPSAAIRTSPGPRARRTSAKLAALQRRLLDRAARLSSPAAGSSTAPVRSSRRKAKARPRLFSRRHPDFARDRRSRLRRSADWPKRSPPPGDLRTLPCPSAPRRRAAAAGSTDSSPPASSAGD